MDIKAVKPIRKNVLIEEYQWPKRTKSGIWMPEMMQYSNSKGGKLPWRGKILAVGGEARQVRPGETVRYQPGNYFRSTVEEDGVRYLVLNEILIYAVEDEDENLIRALENRVVFLPDPFMEKKYGHIYLPQRREEKLLYGTIKVAGPKSGVEPGDRVVLENKSTWQFFTSSGLRFILTDRFNILAVVIVYCECGAKNGHSAGTMQDGTDLIVCNDCGRAVEGAS